MRLSRGFFLCGDSDGDSASVEVSVLAPKDHKEGSVISDTNVLAQSFSNRLYSDIVTLPSSPVDLQVVERSSLKKLLSSLELEVLMGFKGFQSKLCSLEFIVSSFACEVLLENLTVVKVDELELRLISLSFRFVKASTMVAVCD